MYKARKLFRREISVWKVEGVANRYKKILKRIWGFSLFPETTFKE